MGLVVQKYGGTSVADLGRIENVAKRIIMTRDAGHDVVVVLSAMAGETDRLIQLAHKITDDPQEREYDALISTGEQVTVALLCITLNKMGYRAKSFLGFQVKILTDQTYKKARIIQIDTEAIRRELQEGVIVVVAGFQGVD
ncbi:MAG: aspartate kinase, partial [Deltaproteobacteria bacterium]|nr:aspartate kinase [Deltaproteobacteria bacterium]